MRISHQLSNRRSRKVTLFEQNGVGPVVGRMEGIRLEKLADELFPFGTGKRFFKRRDI